jgi:hypothetical protein
MKKYSPTPKDIADAIKHSIPVSARDALGEGWKNLPTGSGSQSKVGKSLSSRRKKSISVSTETVFQSSKRKGMSNSFRRVRVGAFRLELPESAGDSYTDALITLLKSFIKSHPIKT